MGAAPGRSSNLTATVRFLIDENDQGTERIVEYVDRSGSFVLHRFRHFDERGRETWMSVPGCCPEGAHRLLS
jgi:hypothetical protein